MDKEDVTTNLKNAVGNCMLFYQNYDENIEYTEINNVAAKLQKELETIGQNLCEIYKDSNADWKASENNKGYLERIIGDNCKILVPYHLADYFPDSDKLQQLYDIASRVQVSNNGVICISGSSTFLGRLNCISDIDYCEYAPFDKSNGWQKDFLTTILTKQTIQDILFLLHKIFDINKQVIHTSSQQENPDLQNLSHAKLDFVTLFCQTTIEVTNMVLPIDRNNPNDPTFRQSFPFQEAPITYGNWVPQDLFNPLSLGAYVDWLRKEVRKYARENNPIKAAKRALSLSRITGFWEEGDKIIETLESNSDYLNRVIQDAKASLLPKLQNFQNDQNFSGVSGLPQILLDNLNLNNPEHSTQVADDNINYTPLKKKIFDLLNKTNP